MIDVHENGMAAIRPILWLRLLFIIVLVTLGTRAAMAEPRVLSGTVAYRERIALPPSAKVEVSLVDVSRADAPSRTIAETTISPKGQVPVPYRLRYEASDIVPGRSYALQARITVGDRLLFVTTTRHPVFAGGKNETDIIVQHVADTSSPAGRWLAEDIRGGGVIDRLQTVLQIAGDGRISGTGGCNHMSGTATISGAGIAFGTLAATNKACAPAAMDQESKFFSALRDVRAWRIDPVRHKLVLVDKDGHPLMTFTRM